MIQWFVKVLLLVFLLNLTGCTATQTTTAETNGVENIVVDKDSPEKKLRAAKINVRLGMAYLDKRDIQRAKQKFLLALDQGPSLPESWYSMAYFLETTGDRDEARKYYLKAVVLAPNRGDTLNNYGTYLCRRGEYHQAVSQFMLAVRDPQYLDSASAYENAGLCALKIPNLPQAASYFKKAILEDPQRPLSYLALAQIHAKLGNFALAKQELNQFLQISPPNAQSYLLEKKIEKSIST